MKSLKIFSVIFSFFLLGCLLFTSCKSKLPEETKTIYVKAIEKVKDTVFVIEKDSSMYQAYIDCVNGKPVLKQSFEDYQNQHPKTAIVPLQKEGKYLKTPKKPKLIPILNQNQNFRNRSDELLSICKPE